MEIGCSCLDISNLVSLHDVHIEATELSSYSEGVESKEGFAKPLPVLAANSHPYIKLVGPIVSGTLMKSKWNGLAGARESIAH